MIAVATQVFLWRAYALPNSLETEPGLDLGGELDVALST
jgi:hypothetical protein